MISTILGLFGSSGFGGLLGILGGIANRWLDLKTKKMDMELQGMKFQHELNMRDKDREMLITEWEQRSKVAAIEAEKEIEVAGYDALGKSYDADKATYGIVWIDSIRGAIRPVLTALLTIAALAINFVLLDKLVSVWDTIDNTQRLALTTTAAEWVLFQASIAIGWWFAHRPSSRK